MLITSREGHLTNAVDLFLGPYQCQNAVLQYNDSDYVMNNHLIRMAFVFVKCVFATIIFHSDQTIPIKSFTLFFGISSITLY